MQRGGTDCMFIVVGFQHIARVFLGLTIALIATQPQAAEPHGFTQRGGGSIGCYSRRDLRAALVTSVGVTPRLRAQHAVLMDEQLGLTYVRNLDPYGDISSRVSILDSTTGRLLHTVDTRIPASDVAVDAAQGHAFVVQEKDALNTVTDVTMFDARDGRLLRTVHLPPPLGDQTGNVAVDRRTSRLFVALDTPGYPQHIGLFDTRTGALLRLLTVPGNGGMVLDERTGRVFLSGGDDNTISLLDATTGALVRTVAVPQGGGVAGVDETRGHVFVASYSNRSNDAVVTLDARTGAVLHAERVANIDGGPLVAERAGRLFFESDNGDGAWDQVVVIDAATGRLLRRVNVPRGSHLNTVLEGAGLVITKLTGQDASSPPLTALQALDVRDGRVRDTIPLGASGVHSIILGYDDLRGRAMLAHSDGTLYLADVSCV